MALQPIDVNELLKVVRPELVHGDPAALAQAVQMRWRPRQLTQLLRHNQTEVRQVAALALGLIGDASNISSLTRALHDDDWRVNQMAEYALWSIWFRSSDPKAADPFREGIKFLAAESHEKAIEQFLEATQIDPTFAEAFNQCALAYYCLDQWGPAIHVTRQAIALVPMHFGAFAGMGHCYTHLDDIERAVQCYRRALRINPRMPAIANAIDQLSAKLQDLCNSSGQHSLDISLDMIDLQPKSML